MKEPFPRYHEFKYLVTTSGQLDPDELVKMGIKFYPDDINKNEVSLRQNNLYEVNMTDEEMGLLKTLPIVKDIQPEMHLPTDCFLQLVGR